METQPRKISARKAVIASALLLSIGAGGIAASGAWFTSQQSLTANQVKTATVALGNAGTSVTIADVVPIADADIATKAQTFSLKVDNQGSVAVDWAADLILDASTPAGTAGRMLVSYSTDGTTWSAAQPLSTLATTTAPIKGTGLAAKANLTVSFRAWLPGATSTNDDQGQTVKFDLRARIIQAGAGTAALTNNANY